MEIVEYIKKLTDEELQYVVEERIKYLEESEYELPDTIGYILDYNPSDLIYPGESFEDIKKVCLIDNFNGYIPFGTRIVYGMVYNPENGMKSNGARYYYIDDDSYIYDFCKFIRDKEINDEFDIFEYLFSFLQDYFGIISFTDRETMMNYVLKNDYYFYEPTRENCFSMFKGRGNALCSEIAVVAQNILSFLGFDIKYIMGTIKRINEPRLFDIDEIIIKDFHSIDEIKKEIEFENKSREDWEKKKNKYKCEGHAYNMITFYEDGEEESILIDFAASTQIYDFNFKVVGEAPFIYYLDKEKEEMVHEMRTKNKSIEMNNYSYLSQESVKLIMKEIFAREYSAAGNLKYAERKVKIKK